MLRSWQPGTVRLHLSRDSVASGDDVDSHDRDVDVDERCSLATFIQMTVRDGYLPIISGGKATWVAMSGRNGKPVAVVAADWTKPELIVGSRTEVCSIGDSLHFRYLTQRDPQELLDEMRAAHTRANSWPVHTCR